MDSGFVSVVEIGQYFMTKDTLEYNFMRRLRIITTKRMDPWKHKNWTRAGSHDQLLAW